MQGVVLAYDPQTAEGVVIADTDRAQIAIAPGALEGSIFRTLRQGQRVVFELNGAGQAINVRSGAEADLAGPTAHV
ncbi:MAG: hypothetical protein ACOYNI_06440 [Acidimicrobiia bacterium]